MPSRGNARTSRAALDVARLTHTPRRTDGDTVDIIIDRTDRTGRDQVLRALDLQGIELTRGDSITDKDGARYVVEDVTQHTYTFQVLRGGMLWRTTAQRTFTATMRSAQEPSWVAPEAELAKHVHVFTMHGYRTALITEVFSGVDPNEPLGQDEMDDLGLDHRFDPRGPELRYEDLTTDELYKLARIIHGTRTHAQETT